MKIVGLVAAKHNSNRFPGKNIADVDGKPLFWHAVRPLLEAPEVERVQVITDSPIIAAYCGGQSINVIWRPKNATRDDDYLISVLRFGYYNLDIEYDVVVAIMANCYGHTSKDVSNCIKLLIEEDLWEVRSVDCNGVENGILVLRKEILQDNRDISYYLGAIETGGKEVHYETDLR